MSSSPPRFRTRLAVLAGSALVLVGVLALLDTEGAPSPPRLREPQVRTEAPAPANAPASRSESAAPASRSTASASISLAGVVRNRFSIPLADVAVVFDGVERDYEVRTGAPGEFAVADILPGHYQVVAMGSQLLTHSEFVEVTADSGLLVLTVDQGALLFGQVVDDLQRPVEGARVTPWRRGPSGDELEPRCAVRTDPRGRFELRGEENGFTFVLTEHVGCAPAKSRLEPSRLAVVQLQVAGK